MRFRRAPYQDLTEGGQVLAAALQDETDIDSSWVVVAVLPGGAPVGRVVADTLHCPLVALRIDRSDEATTVALEGAEPAQLAGRSVVVVDDGVESGTSARAALSYVKSLAPTCLVFAVPVCHAEGASALGVLVDQLVAPRRPFTPRALRWEYVSFAPPPDDAAALLVAQPLGW